MNKLSARIAQVKFRSWTIPLALLVLCLIGFVPVIHSLGFYWDDWPVIWFLHQYGPSVFLDVVANDRPLSAWYYMLTTSLVGESPLAWHLFSILTRWFSCLALFWTLKSLWPKRVWEATWIVLLFAVYPGFKQQSISVTYSHDWLIQTGVYLSFGLMIWAVRKPGRYWALLIPSWLIAAYSMFAREHYFGLELLRPIIIWMVLAERGLETRKRIGRMAIYWSPYVAVSIAFLIWRIFLFVSPRGEFIFFEQFASQPLIALLNLAGEIVRNFVEMNIWAWVHTLPSVASLEYGLEVLLAFCGIAVIVAALTILYLSRLQVETQPEGALSGDTSKKWATQAIFLGLYTYFISGWPVWLTDMQMRLWFPWDRFGLVTNLGACLLLTGFLALIPRKRQVGAVLLGVIIGLATASQFYYRFSYRQDWLMQRDFFWQLAWRAPGIQPGTTILTSELPFPFDTDNSLNAPLNWIYAPNNTSRRLDYLIYDVGVRQKGSLFDFSQKDALIGPYRATTFEGSTSQAVVLFYNPPNCLKVMHPQLDRKIPGKPRFISEVLSLSKPELIITNPEQPVQPLPRYFGAGPEHDWCYFFEKAELNSQMNDWEQVAILGDVALPAHEITTKNAEELLPFITGYAHMGRWENAVQLSEDAHQASSEMRIQLCRTWRYINDNTDPGEDQRASVDYIAEYLKCSEP